MTVLPRMATGLSSHELKQAREAQGPKGENRSQLRERIEQLQMLNARLQTENRLLKEMVERFAPKGTSEVGTQNMPAPFKSIKP